MKTVQLLIVAVLFPLMIVWAQTPTTTYVIGGTGTAAISTEQAHTGSNSVKLATITTSDRGMVRFSYTAGQLKLDDLTILSYWEYVAARDNPLDVFIDIWLDYDHNGIADVNDYNGYLQAEPYYTVGAAPLTTWTPINAMTLKWSTYVGPNDPYNGPTITAFQNNVEDYDPSPRLLSEWTGGVDFGQLDILRVDIRVGYGGTWTNFTGYADDITINSFTTSFAYGLYLSNSATSLNGTIYPQDSWPLPWLAPGAPPPTMPVGYVGEPNDWGFKSAMSFYIVPEVGSQFSACDIVVEWDNTMYSYLGLENTGIFNTSPLAFFTQQLGTTTRLYIQASILPGPSTPNFFTITSGQYIVKLNFNSLKVGYGGLNFTSLDFRIFDGLGGYQNIDFVQNNAKVKNYLGDVVQTTPPNPSTGDGKVNVDDLNAWTLSYWSGVTGGTGMANYKAKYDIGPTSTTTVYGMPTTDGKIQFEDLVIFAMSYGLSGNNLYPKVAPVPTEPVEVNVGKPIASGNETLVPIFISGAVKDLRAASFTLAGSFGKLISAEKGDLLNSYTTPVMVLSRADGNNVFVDLSIVGADVNGLSEEGQLFVLRFEGKANVNVTSAELRNLANSPMLVKLNGNYKGIPTEFGLAQNYPNPFNPSTMISYQVPVAAMVQIAVFNSIGEKVGTLVNEVKEPGYYEVTWNASAMPSGVYFFRINAGEFSSVKKMMLMK